MLAAAAAAGLIDAVKGAVVDRLLSVDSTVVRAHQHGGGARKTTGLEVVSTAPTGTGATIE